MLCVPTFSAAVVKIAIPPAKDLVPRVVAPSLNVTLPTGVPDPGDTTLTVAVKVTN